MQNPTGGWASYERRRGPMLLEKINPSEVFGDIMVDCDYPECTTSVITALSIFRKHYPHELYVGLQRRMPSSTFTMLRIPAGLGSVVGASVSRE